MLGDSVARRFSNSLPAMLNTRSLAAEEAGMQKFDIQLGIDLVIVCYYLARIKSGLYSLQLQCSHIQTSCFMQQNCHSCHTGQKNHLA